MYNDPNRLSTEDQQEKAYESTGKVIKSLSSEELEQLAKFAFGVNTASELPDKLEVIAREILELRHIYCTTILNWIPQESLRRVEKGNKLAAFYANQLHH